MWICHCLCLVCLFLSSCLYVLLHDCRTLCHIQKVPDNTDSRVYVSRSNDENVVLLMDPFLFFHFISMYIQYTCIQDMILLNSCNMSTVGSYPKWASHNKIRRTHCDISKLARNVIFYVTLNFLYVLIILGEPVFISITGLTCTMTVSPHLTQNKSLIS